MPGVNFRQVTRLVSLERALELLGFTPVRRHGDELRGACPIHRTSDDVGRISRSFAANLALGRFYCHRCRVGGNVLELRAAAKRLSLHAAAIDLCQAAGHEAPWIRRW